MNNVSAFASKGVPERSLMRCVITASTGGSVINECLKNGFFRSLIDSVICDQPCGAAEKARCQGVPVHIFPESSREKFCERLLEYIQKNRIDYVFSFYTKFYSEEIRRALPDRIVNLHPSLLPAFKGNDAWEYVSVYGARFVGSTVEFIYERMDEGKIILQSVVPWDANRGPEFTRHRVFVQQCRALLQVAKWLSDCRVSTLGCQVRVRDAQYESFEFSPALDFDEALKFTCADPESESRGNRGL